MWYSMWDFSIHHLVIFQAARTISIFNPNWVSILPGFHLELLVIHSLYIFQIYNSKSHLFVWSTEIVDICMRLHYRLYNYIYIYIYAATHIKWCNDNILSLPLLSSPQYGMQYPDPAWRESSVDGKVGHHHAKRLWGPDSSSLRSIQPASVFSGLWIHFKYFQLMRGKQSWK